MLSTLFRKKARPAAPTAPAVPDGLAVWAIGDIHGRLDLLKSLMKAVLEDIKASPSQRKLVVFLGDYIDRGPDSRGVIDLLIRLSDVAGVEWHFLKGNHEEIMLRFLDDPSVGNRWCTYGGDAALASWGLKPPSIAHRKEGWAHLSDELNHALTPDQRAFLNALETELMIGDYAFVHAGYRPGVPLADQSDGDRLWIRGDFLDSDVEFDKVVVHGHTPVRSVHQDRRRIAVDTKAYSSGVLTALRLQGTTRSFLQTGQPADGEVSTLKVPS